MSYIESSLGQNEVLHYRARFHWFYHAAAWGALIVSAILALLALNADFGWFSLLSILVGVVILLSILIPIWTTEIGVTNQRIILKRGIVERKTEELQLRSIEQVSFNQDFGGRVFGYGKIKVHGTGDEDILLPAVADPLQLRTALQEAIGSAQGNPPPVDGAAGNQPEPAAPAAGTA